MFSSACVASRVSSFAIHEAETIRPQNKSDKEINANDIEKDDVPNSDEEEEEAEGEPRGRERGREESEEEVEAGDRLTVEVEGSKRRKFIEKVVEKSRRRKWRTRRRLC